MGISRLLELVGQKKTLLVWGAILSTINVFFTLIPYLAVYHVMAELLQNASDFGGIDKQFMIDWAVRGIIALLVGYVFAYVGGMMAHIAAYQNLYCIGQINRGFSAVKA